MEDGAHKSWRWRPKMVNRFYGDGDHQKNMGYTDSQPCACRSYHFTSICDKEFYAYGRSRMIDPSQILSYYALPTKLCTLSCHVRLVVGL